MKKHKYAIAAALSAAVMLFGASCGTQSADVRPTAATTAVQTTAVTTVAQTTTAAQTTTVATTAAATTVKKTQAATKKNVSDSDTIKKTTAKKQTATAAKQRSTTKKKQQTTTKKQTSNKILYHYKDGTTGYTPQDGAWYVDKDGVECEYRDYSKIDSEGRDGIHCPQCGKVMGDGRNGTCDRFLVDTNCPRCGEHVKAMECHTCGK